VKHTPYDGSAKPFTIGLKPLDLREWIDVDDKIDIYFAEKKRLYTEEWSNVYATVPGMEDAEREVLEILTAHLKDTRLPTTAEMKDLPPLAQAGLLVQEDLVIMARSPEGWRLSAASLCFPSAWSLREKIGKLMHEVHGPVPGFSEGTRNAGLIERMFDNRTLFGQDKLYHPVSEGGLKRRFGDGPIAEKVFLRLERQTLRKLPRTGTILFTIRTYIDPIHVLETHPEGAALARAVVEQVQALSPEEIAYKGMTDERDAVLARFQRIADAA
jgi:dimethylamine monooxygenase subunit A